MKSRQKIGALVVAGVLLAGRVLAQPAPADPSHHSSTHDWDFSLETLGYLVPSDISYASPTFTADHRWLHLEGRYNYENQLTGSLWAGYNYNAGHNLVLSVTPMAGVVFGNTTGIAPGYELSLAYKKVELSSQGEYVFDTGSRNSSFFYSWDEATLSLTDWWNIGLVATYKGIPDTTRRPARILHGFLLPHTQLHNLYFQRRLGRPNCCSCVRFQVLAR